MIVDEILSNGSSWSQLALRPKENDWVTFDGFLIDSSGLSQINLHDAFNFLKCFSGEEKKHMDKENKKKQQQHKQRPKEILQMESKSSKLERWKYKGKKILEI